MKSSDQIYNEICKDSIDGFVDEEFTMIKVPKSFIYIKPLYHKKLMKTFINMILDYVRLNSEFIKIIISEDEFDMSLALSVCTKAHEKYLVIESFFTNVIQVSDLYTMNDMIPYIIFMGYCQNMHIECQRKLTLSSNSVNSLNRQACGDEFQLIFPKIIENSLIFLCEGNNEGFGTILDHYGRLEMLNTKEEALIGNTMNSIIPRDFVMAHQISMHRMTSTDINFYGYQFKSFLKCSNEMIIPVYMFVNLYPDHKLNLKFIVYSRKETMKDKYYILLNNENQIINYSSNFGDISQIENLQYNCHVNKISTNLGNYIDTTANCKPIFKLDPEANASHNSYVKQYEHCVGNGQGENGDNNKEKKSNFTKDPCGPININLNLIGVDQNRLDNNKDIDNLFINLNDSNESAIVEDLAGKKRTTLIESDKFIENDMQANDPVAGKNVGKDSDNNGKGDLYKKFRKRSRKLTRNSKNQQEIMQVIAKKYISKEFVTDEDMLLKQMSNVIIKEVKEGYKLIDNNNIIYELVEDKKGYKKKLLAISERRMSKRKGIVSKLEAKMQKGLLENKDEKNNFSKLKNENNLSKNAYGDMSEDKKSGNLKVEGENGEPKKFSRSYQEGDVRGEGDEMNDEFGSGNANKDNKGSSDGVEQSSSENESDSSENDSDSSENEGDSSDSDSEMDMDSDNELDEEYSSFQIECSKMHPYENKGMTEVNSSHNDNDYEYEESSSRQIEESSSRQIEESSSKQIEDSSSKQIEKDSSEKNNEDSSEENEGDSGEDESLEVSGEEEGSSEEEESDEDQSDEYDSSEDIQEEGEEDEESSDGDEDDEESKSQSQSKSKSSNQLKDSSNQKPSGEDDEDEEDSSKNKSSEEEDEEDSSKNKSSEVKDNEDDEDDEEDEEDEDDEQDEDINDEEPQRSSNKKNTKKNPKDIDSFLSSFSQNLNFKNKNNTSDIMSEIIPNKNNFLSKSNNSELEDFKSFILKGPVKNNIGKKQKDLSISQAKPPVEEDSFKKGQIKKKLRNKMKEQKDPKYYEKLMLNKKDLIYKFPSNRNQKVGEQINNNQFKHSILSPRNDKNASQKNSAPSNPNTPKNGPKDQTPKVAVLGLTNFTKMCNLGLKKNKSKTKKKGKKSKPKTDNNFSYTINNMIEDRKDGEYQISKKELIEQTNNLRLLNNNKCVPDKDKLNKANNSKITKSKYQKLKNLEKKIDTVQRVPAIDQKVQHKHESVFFKFDLPELISNRNKSQIDAAAVTMKNASLTNQTINNYVVSYEYKATLYEKNFQYIDYNYKYIKVNRYQAKTDNYDEKCFPYRYNSKSNSSSVDDGGLSSINKRDFFSNKVVNYYGDNNNMKDRKYGDHDNIATKVKIPLDFIEDQVEVENDVFETIQTEKFAIKEFVKQTEYEDLHSEEDDEKEKLNILQAEEDELDKKLESLDIDFNYYIIEDKQKKVTMAKTEKIEILGDQDDDDQDEMMFLDQETNKQKCGDIDVDIETNFMKKDEPNQVNEIGSNDILITVTNEKNNGSDNKLLSQKGQITVPKELVSGESDDNKGNKDDKDNKDNNDNNDNKDNKDNKDNNDSKNKDNKDNNDSKNKDNKDKKDKKSNDNDRKNRLHRRYKRIVGTTSHQNKACLNASKKIDKNKNYSKVEEIIGGMITNHLQKNPAQINFENIQNSKAGLFKKLKILLFFNIISLIMYLPLTFVDILKNMGYVKNYFLMFGGASYAALDRLKNLAQYSNIINQIGFMSQMMAPDRQAAYGFPSYVYYFMYNQITLKNILSISEDTERDLLKIGGNMFNESMYNESFYGNYSFISDQAQPNTQTLSFYEANIVTTSFMQVNLDKFPFYAYSNNSQIPVLYFFKQNCLNSIDVVLTKYYNYLNATRTDENYFRVSELNLSTSNNVEFGVFIGSLALIIIMIICNISVILYIRNSYKTQFKTFMGINPTFLEGRIEIQLECEKIMKHLEWIEYYDDIKFYDINLYYSDTTGVNNRDLKLNVISKMIGNLEMMQGAHSYDLNRENANRDGTKKRTNMKSVDSYNNYNFSYNSCNSDNRMNILPLEEKPKKEKKIIRDKNFLKSYWYCIIITIVLYAIPILIYFYRHYLTNNFYSKDLNVPSDKIIFTTEIGQNQLLYYDYIIDYLIAGPNDIILNTEKISSVMTKWETIGKQETQQKFDATFGNLDTSSTDSLDQVLLNMYYGDLCVEIPYPYIYNPLWCHLDSGSSKKGLKVMFPKIQDWLTKSFQYINMGVPAQTILNDPDYIEMEFIFLNIIQKTYLEIARTGSQSLKTWLVETSQNLYARMVLFSFVLILILMISFCFVYCGIKGKMAPPHFSVQMLSSKIVQNNIDLKKKFVKINGKSLNMLSVTKFNYNTDKKVKQNDTNNYDYNNPISKSNFNSSKHMGSNKEHK